MAQVVALYRYPVKGFSAEPREHLDVLAEGRIAGDRVLNFRFADAPVADDQWCRKYHGIVLANTPGIARLEARFDGHDKRLRLTAGGALIADEPLSPGGRRRLESALTEYVLGLDDNPLAGHPERLPIKLVGDGSISRYQDNSAGMVTLHGRASVAAAGSALNDPELSELRFRHNIALDGLKSWEELTWIGRRVRIGAVELSVLKGEVRCLATHANPVTGERDRTVMQTLVRAFGQKEPTLGIGMSATGAGGTIRVGDEVTLID